MPISRLDIPGGFIAYGVHEPSADGAGPKGASAPLAGDAPGGAWSEGAAPAAGPGADAIAGVRAPLVVCSPAMGDTRDVYNPLAQALCAAGFRVVTADLRGHGDSSAAFDRYGDDATADDLIALIEGLDAGPAVLVGASMSGASAVIAAGRRPDLVAGLVLICPFLRGSGSRIKDALLRAVLGLALLRPWGPVLWRRYSASLWPGLPDADGRAARLTALLRRPGRWRVFRATTRTDYRVVEPWFETLACPALVIIGEEAPDWKEPAAEAAWAAAAVSRSGEPAPILMVPGAGHAPMLERPGAIGPRIVDFARSACAPTNASGAVEGSGEGRRTCPEPGSVPSA